jgi:hypothetical protein
MHAACITFVPVGLQGFDQQLGVSCELKKSAATGSNAGHEIRSDTSRTGRFSHPGIVAISALGFKADCKSRTSGAKAQKYWDLLRHG